ncbi:MAG: hypothetical protein GXX87_00765 [Euryarchaeota archaeon]|nr:hypothetical protein [Euryarchaeota archaeon]
MSEEVHIIQAVATGPNGFPYDEIIEIAVCRADLDARTSELVCESLIFYDPRKLGKPKLDYLSEAAGITGEAIYAGEAEADVVGRVMGIIEGESIACYDARQEFGRYMTCAPWDITHRTTVMPSISARMPISLRCKHPQDEPDIIRKAYRRLIKGGDPSLRNGRRAGDLARMSAALMFHMIDKGKY